MKTKVSALSVENEFVLDKVEFVPAMRSGAWSDIGSRSSMEDAYLCLDNLMDSYGLKDSEDGPTAFYGVFDGHGGKHAAEFACQRIPRYIVEDQEFPSDINKVVSSAFLRADAAFSEACALDGSLSSGTTALAAILTGRFVCLFVHLTLFIFLLTCITDLFPNCVTGRWLWRTLEIVEQSCLVRGKLLRCQRTTNP